MTADSPQVAPPVPTSATEITVVVPFMNARHYLIRTIPALWSAASEAGCSIILVDNGSTDGSAEWLRANSPMVPVILEGKGLTIGGLRNLGARAAGGRYLSFLDADCLIEPSYFTRAVSVLATAQAAATGCEYDLPEAAHWIERTHHAMHFVGRAREVVYINSGNFFVERSAFERVGGFDSTLLTGEDADIGHRLVRAGFRIYESPDVRAFHLGNAKTLRQHYRRTLWHGLGMLSTLSTLRVDRPTCMLLAHLTLTLTSVVGVLQSRGSLAGRLLAVVFAQLAVPVVTVVFRWFQTRRRFNAAAGVVLYWLYYWARAHALLLVMIGRGAHIRR